MDIFSRFKKDYFNYLISIIIPVIINAASIPLFKRLLGAAGYGKFSILFNTLLLIAATLSGWISQSVIRYYPASIDKLSFAKNSLAVSAITQAVFFFPVIMVVWWIQQDILIAVFFALALFVTSLQFSILSVSQSVFLSKKSIHSEFIRSVSNLCVALLLIKFTNIKYLYALLIAVIVSYLFSFIYLQYQTGEKIKLSILSTNDLKQESRKNLLKKFLLYGAPLSLWFIFAYLLSLTDKYFMLHKIGAEVQGNYQAIFDFISKSITLVISPLAISLLPVLTNAYERGKKDEIRKLLNTIFLIEIAGLAVTIICYWWFGAEILFTLVHVPNTINYKLMGLIVIAGTFIWQLAIVVQKHYELQYKSKILLVLVIIAFLVQLFLYLTFGAAGNPILYPLGYAISALVYLVLLSFKRVVHVIHSLFNKMIL